MSTAFHPASNGQTENANKIVEEALRNFCGAEVKHWVRYLPFVEFCLNNAKSQSTGLTPFYMNYGRHPRTPLLNGIPDGVEQYPTLKEALEDLEAALVLARKTLQAAQDRQAEYANGKRQPHAFDVGQWVLLSSKNMRFQGKGRKKLFPRFMGPFCISEMVGPNAATLELPDSWSMHRTFHVSLLKPYKGTPPVDRQNVVPVPLAPDSTPLFQVESIIQHRTRDVKRHEPETEYLVRWRGLSDEHCTWESEAKLPSEDIEEYWNLLTATPDQ
jgi:hypothetical protein